MSSSPSSSKSILSRHAVLRDVQVPVRRNAEWVRAALAAVGLACSPAQAAVLAQEPGVCLAGVPIAFRVPSVVADSAGEAMSPLGMEPTPAGDAGEDPTSGEPAAAPPTGAAISSAGGGGNRARYAAGACLAGTALAPPGMRLADGDAEADSTAAEAIVEAEPEYAPPPPPTAGPTDDTRGGEVPLSAADVHDARPGESATAAELAGALTDGAGSPAAAKKREGVTAPRPTASRPPQPAAAEALKAWWPAPEAGQLNLVYAGPAAFDQAIVLLFDAPFEGAENASAHIEVRGQNGEVINGEWQIAPGNRRMLMFKGRPGRYTVKIGSALSAGGRTLPRSLSGPVHLR